MKRIVGVLALVVVSSLFGASEVLGGFGGVLAGKTGKPILTGTIITDVTTGPAAQPGRGLTAIRVQKGPSLTSAFFVSAAIRDGVVDCATLRNELKRFFEGYFVDVWLSPPQVRQALFQAFGDPEQVVVTDTNHGRCTVVEGREVLSFDAEFRFGK